MLSPATSTESSPLTSEICSSTRVGRTSTKQRTTKNQMMILRTPFPYRISSIQKQQQQRGRRPVSRRARINSFFWFLSLSTVAFVLVGFSSVVVVGVAAASEDHHHKDKDHPSSLRASHHHQQAQQHKSPQKQQQQQPANHPHVQQQQQYNKEEIEEATAKAEGEFLDWCRRVLGITTSSIQIQTFEYYDYMKALADKTDQFCEDEDDWIFDDTTTTLLQQLGGKGWEDDNTAHISVADYPRIPVRGLAASQDIAVGEVLIRIPYQALLTVSNLIDRDPVLSRVIGKEARRKYGWNKNSINNNNLFFEDYGPEDKDRSHGDNDNYNDDSEDAVHYYYELPLLAVAVLHHVQLGPHSSLAPYVQLLKSSPVDTMPHMWTTQRLRSDASEAVRRVARGIQHDVREMYSAVVVDILMRDHPHLFANPNNVPPPTNPKNDDHHHHHHGSGSSTNHSHSEGKKIDEDVFDDDGMTDTTEEDDDDDDDDEEEALLLDEDPTDREHPGEDEEVEEKEWGFSFEKFQWAFALVNSRHFHVPIPSSMEKSSRHNRETETNARHRRQEDEDDDEEELSHENNDVAIDQPPAAMPTEEWIREQQHHHQHNQHHRKGQEGRTQQERLNNKDGEPYPLSYASGSSFLAPVADLLNFGPPCTRGRYNDETQSFEIIATCHFQKGQEITFWYSDACDDIVVGNYGFTHPMVPPCPNLYHWQKQAQLANAEVAGLQEALANAYYDLDTMDVELERVQRVLNDCECCDDKDPKDDVGVDDEIGKTDDGGSMGRSDRQGNRYNNYLSGAPPPMTPRRKNNPPPPNPPATATEFGQRPPGGSGLPKTSNRKSDRGL